MRGFCIITGKDNYMTVFFELDKNDILTEEQKKEIQNAKSFPITDDEDCPVYSYEKLCQMLENTEKRKNN